uniref:Uncharacterized protein n=1 Tax=Anguilla anguilla TaxID=7936 RepID=A0A0E9S473_ANGAN
MRMGGIEKKRKGRRELQLLLSSVISLALLLSVFLFLSPGPSP